MILSTANTSHLTMKKFLFTLLVISIAFGAVAQKEIKPEDAKDNVGKTVKICTKIQLAVYHENLDGRPTRLFTSADSAHSPVTFIIWGENRRNFDYQPEKDLKEREVCITGKIELLTGKPVIVIEKQSQVSVK